MNKPLWQPSEKLKENSLLKDFCKFINFDSSNNVCLNGRCLSTEIRSKRISSEVSSVSALKLVRDKMVKIQRKIAEGKNCILEGRDIGTVVFPDAEFKFFLDAKIEDRAKRRLLDFKKNGENFSLNEVIKQIEERDGFDSLRKISPLKMSKNAILIDTSKLSINEQINKIVSLVTIKFFNKEIKEYE